MRNTLAHTSCFVLCMLGTALAGESTNWVEFIDATDERLVGAPAVGVDNTDEKDYAWGDLDHDGDPDLVAVYKGIETQAEPRPNALFMNEGGVLVERTAEYASASTVTLQSGQTSQGFLDPTVDRDVQLADINGDGWLDVITATTRSGPLGKAISHPRVYLNLGDDPPHSGVWQGLLFDDEDRVPTMPGEPHFDSVAVGDVDDDGDADLYFTDARGINARPDLDDRLWINDGSGTFTDETAARMTFEMVESSYGTSCAIADMNGDGLADILKVDWLNAPQALSISYNDPGNPGHFAAYELAYQFAATHVAVGDLNKDGLPDLVITDDSRDYYQLNLGNGPDGLADFTPRILIIDSPPQFGGPGRLADLDGDTYLDVLIPSPNTAFTECPPKGLFFRTVVEFPNVTIELDGTGGIDLVDLRGVHDFAVFDLDSDGDNDLVTGTCSGTRIYLNLQSGADVPATSATGLLVVFLALIIVGRVVIRRRPGRDPTPR